MIRVDSLSARKNRLFVRDVSFTAGRGVHALLGALGDGPSLTLEALAGTVKTTGGRVTIADRPAGDPGVRRVVAYVPREPVLPDAMRVSEALDLAAKIRGELPIDARERLEVLGVASLANRKTSSLSVDETRAVAMAEALTSRQTVVFLLDEPFVAIDPRAAACITAAIRSRASKGACVLVATASPRDAAALADTQLTFDRGTLVRHSEILDPIATAPAGTMLRVSCSDPRALLAAIASEPAVTAVNARGGVLLLEGQDLVQVARAVAKAARNTRVIVHEIMREAPSLDEARAAASGAATAAFHLAYERTRGALGPPSSPPSAALRAPPSSPPSMPLPMHNAPFRGEPAE